MNYRILLAYEGTDYCGWQMQLGRPTIQGVLSEVLARFAGAPVVAHGAGRTDAGVHAEGQVVSFRLTKLWEGTALRRALNANLPLDVRVLEAVPVADDFHARFNARSKTYRYQIYNAEVMTPCLARYAWHYPYPLEIEELAVAGQALLGTHDFTAFTVAACEVKSHVRTITDFRVETDGPLLRLFFSADGFLRYQVRTMAGALMAANRGRLPAGSVAALLRSRKRQLAGAPAPAHGLTLMKVEY